MPTESENEPIVDLSGKRFSTGFAIFFFAFGIAAGLLLAFTGLGFLENSASVIAGVFLFVVLAVGLVGLIIFALRHRIMERLFGITEAQVELFAGPLTGVAEGAAERDPVRAIQSARRLIQLALARYAWLATRRWIMTSLTALIAAMAAFAGTALLFKQNSLIEAQTVLLAEQNQRIGQQNQLLEQQTRLAELQIELVEAARNAELAIEVNAVAALLGAAADREAETRGATLADGPAGLIPMIDPARDLPRSTIFRIVSLSQGMRPYRFLEGESTALDPNARVLQAMTARREDLPALWERIVAQTGWRDPAQGPQLIDRPASPERGHLLRVMVQSGLRELDLLNHFGLDLSHAHAPGLDLLLVSARQARLSGADLSHAHLREVELAGAALDNARFLGSTLSGIRMAADAGGAMPGLLPAANMTGADLSGALLAGSDLAGVEALGVIFDDATLVGVNLSGASLGASRLRGAVLADVRLEGADLRMIDLDGAIIIGPEPLAALSAAAQPGTFRADRYRAHPIELAEAEMAGRLWEAADLGVALDLSAGTLAWRIERIAPLED
jgi:uncharacterized protein YjbI with pentapeptide repeats